MNKHTLSTAGLISCAAFIFAGCQTQAPATQTTPSVNVASNGANKAPQNYIITPKAIPGTPRVINNGVTGGYAPSKVQAQLNIDVAKDTKQIKVIRDTTDPFVITKPYVLKYADPYAVRSYLEAAVGARSVTASPVQATAVKFDDNTGVVLVSAESYRFEDSKAGKGIDGIIKSLDRKGLTFMAEADTYLYFPRISRAANLRDMILRVGSYELDPQFAVAPSMVTVDAQLNAIIVKAPRWTWAEILPLLQKYDRQIPEVKISYKVLEIYAENDDRIGNDFQSWKNNEGIDLFSAGVFSRRNWGTFFTTGVQNNDGFSKTQYWNFNPKWNTRYLDFMTSIGQAKCLAQGVITAQNRIASSIQVNSGFFYDRTYYEAINGTLTKMSDVCKEFTYTLPNPDTIQREATTKILPLNQLNSFYNEAWQSTGLTALIAQPVFQQTGYTMRMIGTQTSTPTYRDTAGAQMAAGLASGALTGQKVDPTVAASKANSSVLGLSKYLSGYIYSGTETVDGQTVLTKTTSSGAYYNTNAQDMNTAPGIIHGWLQYPMVTDGFKFQLNVTPIVTGKAATLQFDLRSVSLLGWNSDGSARTSNSSTSTTVQIGYDAKEFVIGGLRKSESVRGNTGLPFFKDLPVIGRLFSTETESIKQSMLVLVAEVKYSNPTEVMGSTIKENIGKINKQVNKGMTSKVGNMFFQQYLMDEDRADRSDRLDGINDRIEKNYKNLVK